MDTETPRVLVVDDDSAVLQTYLRVLHDCAPLQASDGVEARKILSEREVDVVLCDLEMPRMNGLELMQWAKEHCPRPLWIVISGEGTFSAAAEALKLGAFAFICKPIVSPLQLQTAVANAIRHQTFATERAVLARSLTDRHAKLEAVNATLTEQRALLDQDLQRAARIVRALLSRALGAIDHLQVNVAYRPSRTIGGDFYGAVMRDDHHLAVYVADVAGHGVSAALLAVLFNQRLSVFNAVRGPRSPAAVLSDMNRALQDECRVSGLFVTVAYALINTAGRTVTIASAGHPPGVLLRATGGCEHLEKTGPALGLGPDAHYDELRVSLSEGDRLLLFSDGVSGALAARGQSVDASLASAAKMSSGGSSVIVRLLASTGPERDADDDRTLLLVTARSGVSTFDIDPAERRRSAPSDCPLWVGNDRTSTWIAIRGRATWKDAAVLRDTCVDALDAGRRVIVDLAACSMLDSTVLGTLHDVIVRTGPAGAIQIQAVSEGVHRLFAELAMTQVLSSIDPCPEAVPVTLRGLHTESVTAATGMVLRAHQLLAQLSVTNAAQFQPVVDALQSELSA
jgi:phosphoserine phosphatase RsbU/P